MATGSLGPFQAFAALPAEGGQEPHELLMLGKYGAGLLGLTLSTEDWVAESVDSIPGVWALWETGTCPIASGHRELLSTSISVTGTEQ